GALLTGTVVLSFPLLLAAIPDLGPNVNVALFAFVIGTALAGSLPTLRDAVLPVIDGARYVALVIILGGAGLAALSRVDLRAVADSQTICLARGPDSTSPISFLSVSRNRLRARPLSRSRRPPRRATIWSSSFSVRERRKVFTRDVSAIPTSAASDPSVPNTASGWRRTRFRGSASSRTRASR